MVAPASRRLSRRHLAFASANVGTDAFVRPEARKRRVEKFPANKNCAVRNGQRSRVRKPNARSRKPVHPAGGTYSFGFSDPSPKKNISICFTITS